MHAWLRDSVTDRVHCVNGVTINTLMQLQEVESRESLFDLFESGR